MKPISCCIYLIVIYLCALSAWGSDTGRFTPSNPDETILEPLTDSEADAYVKQAREEAQTVDEQEAARKRAAFFVLDENEVEASHGHVVYRRVVPPNLAELESAMQKPSPTVASTVDLAEQERLARLAQTQFHYSATVYDRAVTRLRWQHDGQTYVAWSNVDFNYLRGITQLEHGDTLYHMLMGIGNERTPERAFQESALPMSRVSHSPVPLLPTFTPGRAEYAVFVEEGQPPPLEEAFTPIDLLHLYYEQNAQALQTEYQQREALNEAQRRYDDTHPKPKEDTVIHFWPEKNSAYETTDPGQNAKGATP